MWSWLHDLLYGGSIVDRSNDSINSSLGRPTPNRIPFESLVGSPKPKPPSVNPSIGSNAQRILDNLSGVTSGIGQRANSSGMPSLAEIMSRLEALQDPSRYMMSRDELMRQAVAGASAQYDPVIAQLRNAQRQAQTRGESDRQALGQMFGQLSASLNADIAPLEQKNAQTRQGVQDQFANLKQSINQTYDDAQKQQEEMMQRLNIQAAAPEVLGKQERDQAYFVNRANTDENTATTALDQESRGNVEYTRRGAEVANVEGTQRQADLMAQLSQLMNAYQSQIGANEAAKGAAVQKMFGELSGQANDQAFKLSQRDFDNYLQSIQMGRMLNNDALSRLGKGNVQKASSLADIGGRAMTLGLPSSSAQKIQNVFQTAVGGDQRILGGLNPDTGQALNDYQMANYVVEAGRAQGLSQAELNALQAIALEYFK